jgi:hypothetical protein
MSHQKRRENQKKNKRTHNSDFDEILKKEWREMKKEQTQGDILLLVRNFTWTRNQEVWPNKFLHHQEKARNDLSYFQFSSANYQFNSAPKSFKCQLQV